MRSIDEQMGEILRRKAAYAAAKALRRKMIAAASACGGCVAALIAVIALLPRLDAASGQAPIRQYGSMVLKLPAAGYVLVAALSFALGVAVTLLCRYARQYRERER